MCFSIYPVTPSSYVHITQYIHFMPISFVNLAAVTFAVRTKFRVSSGNLRRPSQLCARNTQNTQAFLVAFQGIRHFGGCRAGAGAIRTSNATACQL
ncbi:uncharacterized protein EURHEDRAFT_314110 [Aspergillus ruber CBS 135680]|uniref:Uncharacterized protein n=1 Tax=Aspergillus ruber (strain CBS 135680) TaxID=1388766 RepID=A0A017S248_ASPRC|nr:uncharacterized protein EURHEDRAFT_314110 [Aspergillus ruber CBS 135680]EYE90245.1 hypothetical protein EURHEDRAFT_314110 [Aspergillus ruber CBS 135680]